MLPELTRDLLLEGTGEAAAEPEMLGAIQDACAAQFESERDAFKP